MSVFRIMNIYITVRRGERGFQQAKQGNIFIVLRDLYKICNNFFNFLKIINGSAVRIPYYPPLPLVKETTLQRSPWLCVSEKNMRKHVDPQQPRKKILTMTSP